MNNRKQTKQPLFAEVNRRLEAISVVIADYAGAARKISGTFIWWITE